MTGRDAIQAYEQHAKKFLDARDASQTGADVVKRWARSLHSGASVLELACGGGFPITSALISAGLDVHAIDSSPTLLETFQARFPEVPVRCESVQASTFFDRNFDAVIAVGLMFLLSEPDQIDLMGRVANALRPGGRFLFSAPVQAGTWSDMTTGVDSVSLGADVYERTLAEAGFRVIQRIVDQGDNNYYDSVFDTPAVPID
ncbi:MAG: class I SAM-dependent methyltransferase [Pseudomonadota bacterium]